jgi:hypothetical protein
VRFAVTTDGREYVHVEPDGSARELSEDERAYLREEFNPMDGARPYVKSRYHQLTPDRNIRGFLLRSKLPAGLAVAAAPDQTST